MRLHVISHKRVWLKDGQYYTIGGFPRQMEALQQLFDEVVICSPIPREQLPPGSVNLTEMGFKVHPLLYIRTRTIINKLLFFLMSPVLLWQIWAAVRQAEVIQIRIPNYIGVLGALLARTSDKPVFVWLAGDWSGVVLSRGRTLLRRLGAGFFWHFLPWLLRDFLIFAPEPDVLNNKQQQLNLVRVVNTPIWQHELPRIDYKEIPVHPSQLALLYVGRLDYVKGIDILLQALGQLEQDNWTLTILGGGNKGGLETLAKELAIADKITFHGRVPRETVNQFYLNSDVVVVPSRNEMSPKVVMEAMSYGLVVIGSQVGAIPTLLGDGRGILVEAEAIEGLAETIRDLFTHPAKLKPYSEKALEFAQANTLETLNATMANALTTYLNLSLNDYEAHQEQSER